MGLKLTQSNGRDFPVLMCDVCNGRIYDLFGDLASGSRVDGGLGNIVIHHKACPTTEALHMPLNKFFALTVICNRMGDLASNGVTETLKFEFPVDGGFDEYGDN